MTDKPFMAQGKYSNSHSGLELFKRDAEAAGHTVFRSEKWDELYARGLTFEEAKMGTLQGAGCEYFFYQRGDGTCVTTYRGSGPWPYASVEWVLTEAPIDYTHAVIKVMVIDAISNGEYSVDDVRDVLTKVVLDL